MGFFSSIFGLDWEEAGKIQESETRPEQERNGPTEISPWGP